MEQEMLRNRRTYEVLMLIMLMRKMLKRVQVWMRLDAYCELLRAGDTKAPRRRLPVAPARHLPAGQHESRVPAMHSHRTSENLRIRDPDTIWNRQSDVVGQTTAEKHST